MSRLSLSIAIAGAGGSGVISCGELLLRAWARDGGHGLLRKTFGPQIRGGEAAALLKLTEDERYTAARRYDVLVALDWMNFERFQDEIRLSDDAVIICESAATAPAVLAERTLIELPLAALAKDAHPEGRANMVALGLIGGALPLPQEYLCELTAEHLASKPDAYREAAARCIAAGAEQTLELPHPPPSRTPGERWCITGNQAAALGALQAGVRFVAAYPITPASDLLEWIAQPIEQLAGRLVQAEDELAAINMTIGAAYGGVPALTATSGPGLALMSESLGLAVAAEVPLCVVDVQRGGPSTGIPTKSEQSDLDIALHGLHGDAPHLVLAPLGTADCVFTTGWASSLSQQLQVPSIVLSDQFIGQSIAVISPPRQVAPISTLTSTSTSTPTKSQPDVDYLRYRLTESGVSAPASPGDLAKRFTADGLEHNERGTPSASSKDHIQQLDKRARKLSEYDYGADWADIAGEGQTALVGFGSTAATLAEAANLSELGVRTVALRLLAPLQIEALEQALAGCTRIVVVEQNHRGQLHAWLQSQLPPGLSLERYARPGPTPLDPQAIADLLTGEHP